MKHFLNSVFFIVALMLAAWLPRQASAATYYVDYVNGSDSSAGTSTGSAWQHCPGDNNATGAPLQAANRGLAPGDTILFKGGVIYRGTVQFNFVGTSNNPITIAGDGWGTPKAIISGAELITTPWTKCTNAADAHGSANYNNYWWTPCVPNMSLVTTLSKGTNEQYYFAQDPNPASWLFFQQLTDGSFRTCTWNNPANNQFVWSGNMPYVWTHVAVTKSGTNVTFYVNGQATPGTALNTTFTFTNNAAIGAQGDSLSNAFAGYLDEVAVYSRALAPSEIQSIYAAGTAGLKVNGIGLSGAVTAPSGLAACWRGDGTFTEALSGAAGTAAGNVGFTNGEVGQAIRIWNNTANSVNVGSGVTVGNPTALQTQDFTIEAWVNRQAYGGYIFAYGTGGYGLYSDVYGGLYLNQVGTTNQSIGLSKLQDTQFFTSSDPNYYVNSILYMWVSPNELTPIPIRGYDPATHTITFQGYGVTPENTSVNGQNATYYKILNNPGNLDHQGEYSVMTNENRIYFYSTNQPSNIEVARRCGAVQVSAGGNLNIRGFTIVSQCVGQPGFGNGVGIAIWNSGSAYVTNVNIINNTLMFCNDPLNVYASIYMQGGQAAGAGGNVIGNTIHDCLNRGITDAGDNSIIASNEIYNIVGTGMYVSGCNKTIAYNYLHDILGIHANGFSTYGNSASYPVGHLMFYGNRAINMPRCYTLEVVSNIYVFNNIFDAKNQYNAVVDWGGGAGTNYFVNNVIIGDMNNNSLQFMPSDSGDVKFVVNNILGGMAANCTSGPMNVYSATNIYVAVNQYMNSGYNWTAGPAEIINTNLNLIFTNTFPTMDYHLRSGSLAGGRGTDLSKLGYTNDLDQVTRTGAWDMGAYAYLPPLPPPANLQIINVQ